MSPIPLGIWATAGAGAAGGGAAYELIETAYGTGSSGTITFSSIPQTYKHLQVRAVTRSTYTSTAYTFTRFNGSSTGYAMHGVEGTSSSPSAYAYPNDSTATYTAGIAGSSAGGYTTMYSSQIFDLLDYANTNKTKALRILTGLYDNPSSGQRHIGLHSGLWANTAAVTSIQFSLTSGNYDTATRFSLYGIQA